MNLPDYILKKIRWRLLLFNLEFIGGLMFSFIGLFSLYHFIIALFIIGSPYIPINYIVETEAKISNVEPTRYGIEDGPTIYKYSYEYIYEGVEYQSKGFANEGVFKYDEVISIKLKKGNYANSKAEELRKTPLRYDSALFLLAIIFGAYFSLKGFKKYKKRIAIFRNAVLTRGWYLFSEETNEESDNQPVYKHFYKFKDIEGNEVRSSNERTSNQLNDKLYAIYNELDTSQSIILNDFPVKGVEKVVMKKVMEKVKDLSET